MSLYSISYNSIRTGGVPFVEHIYLEIDSQVSTLGYLSNRIITKPRV